MRSTGGSEPRLCLIRAGGGGELGRFRRRAQRLVVTVEFMRSEDSAMVSVSRSGRRLGSGVLVLIAALAMTLGLVSPAEAAAAPTATRSGSTSYGYAAYDLISGEMRAAGVSTGPAWSTAKLLVVTSVLAIGIPPTASVRADISSALSRSDNEAAIRLHKMLIARRGSEASAARYMEMILRRGDDFTTRVSLSFNGRNDAVTHWGQTQWSTRAQARWLARLFSTNKVLTASSRKIVTSAMGHVVDYQSWGLGSAGFKYFKGGWGHDAPLTVRQVGVFGRHGRLWAVAIIMRSDIPGLENHDGDMTAYARSVVSRLP